MITTEITVKNTLGLQSKPAAMFIQKASTYKSTIWIEKNERKANAKSLLSVLAMAVGKGEKFNLIVDGEDEEKATYELAEYINSGLGESV